MSSHSKRGNCLSTFITTNHQKLREETRLWVHQALLFLATRAQQRNRKEQRLTLLHYMLLLKPAAVTNTLALKSLVCHIENISNYTLFFRPFQQQYILFSILEKNSA